MKPFISFLITVILLASCENKQEAMLSATESRKADSLALRVALIPTWGCMPMYYALRTGITDSLGLDVRLLRYNAQLDIDTAVTRRHTDVAFSDIIRAIRLTDTIRISAFLTAYEPIFMVAQKGKKITKLSHMKEKMIAICRLCATDYWSEKMLDSANVNFDDVFRPQINDVKLRGKMLRTGLLEGAMLEEPYASWAFTEGNKELFHAPDSLCFSVWIMADSLRKDKRKKEQIRLFAIACQTAAENISQGLHSDTLRTILKEEYGLPDSVADSIQLPPPTIKLCQPRQKDVEEATQWLSEKGRLPKKFTPETFIFNPVSNKK